MTATDTWTEFAARPEPKRDRYGRYLIEGQPYTRVTTWAETGDDRHNLEKWMVRTTALGLVQRPDLFALVASTPPDDRAKLNRICDDAREAAKGSAGANLGTALHRFAERIDAGEDVAVPDAWRPDLDAYRSALAAAGVEVVRDHIERVVVVDDLHIAGTFDRLVRIPGRPLPVVADLKTGADLSWSWGAIAIQLAAYANASRIYDVASDTTGPMLEVDREVALVIHLPAGAGRCELHLVDIVAGWEMAQVCGAVRAWRKRKDLARPFERPVEAQPADPARVEWLRERAATVVAAGHGAKLAEVWPAGVPTFKQGGLTAAHLDAIAPAISAVEDMAGLPFPAADPTKPEPAQHVEVAPVERPEPSAKDVLVGRMAAASPETRATLKAFCEASGLPTAKSRLTGPHIEVLAAALDLLDGGFTGDDLGVVWATAAFGDGDARPEFTAWCRLLLDGGARFDIDPDGTTRLTLTDNGGQS